MNAYSFLLVDAALAGFNDRIDLRPAGDTPSWLCPLYEGAAVWTGPVLIDILAAEEAGALDHAMAIVNARFPQLHLSLIDTTMHFDELADHLRRFRSVYNREHENFSLRFADCLVLAALQEVLDAAQWATISAPIGRWWVHLRNGRCHMLTLLKTSDATVHVPIQLTVKQLANLRDIFAPDRMIGYLRGMAHGEIPGTYAEQYDWAKAAYALWEASGNRDEIVWRWLTEATLQTRGRITRDAALAGTLCGQDLEQIRVSLRVIMQRCAAPGTAAECL